MYKKIVSICKFDRQIYTKMKYNEYSLEST